MYPYNDPYNDPYTEALIYFVMKIDNINYDFSSLSAQTSSQKQLLPVQGLATV